jgi:purine-binding chemotaxis protein CheW
MPEAAADKEEVLCFSISGETFGINIMQIKEILKPRPVTEVPRAPSFVSGVISLRGVILPVLDLHDRLGLEHPATSGRERLVVVKTGQDGDLAGLLVDQVLQVVRIPGAIEPAPPNLAGIDRDFVVGIGRADNRIVFLLNPGRLVDLHLSKGAQP